MHKILRVITRLNVGGPAQHVILLAHLMPQQGFAEMLITGCVDDHEGDMTDLARLKGVVPVAIPTLRNRAGVVADLFSLYHLYRLFRRERPAIVHLHLLKARALGSVAARLAHVPIVVETFHGTLFAEYYRPLISQFLLLGERWLARMVDAVITVSDQVAAEVVRLRIASRDKVRMIPLGLDLGRFLRESRDRGTLRQELSLLVDTPTVGWVGRMVAIKGLPYLLEAVPMVLRMIPEAVFVLIGDGPDRAALEGQARRLGIDQAVRFLGWRKNLEALYPDLDVVVLSSLNEGTPVAVIEAMAAGRPVVAARVGGVPDVICDSTTGILVSPRDARSLADAIVGLLQDAALRERLGTAAREAVYPRFSTDRLVRDMDGLYRKLLAQKGMAVESSR